MIRTLLALLLLIPSLSWALTLIGDNIKEYSCDLKRSSSGLAKYDTPLRKDQSYNYGDTGSCITFTKVKKFKVRARVPNECLLNKFCTKTTVSIDNNTSEKSNVKEFVYQLSQNLCKGAFKIQYKDKIRTNSIIDTVWTGSTTYVQINCLETQKRWEEEQKLEKIAKQKEKEKSEKISEEKKQQALLDTVNSKRELCFRMGFKEGTDPLANCILQLMLDENKKEQVLVTGDSDALDENNAIMDRQTQIMEKQLKLQKIENSQKALKSFQYMMDYGKVPPAGYGY